jgi:hypothetical protein
MKQFAPFLTAGWAKAKILANNAASHIHNRRLGGAGEGVVLLDDRERRHLDNCVECQEVLYFYVTAPKSQS